ncbi:MAG TPA: efflux RND transporter permease subunit [Planctomycetota bacterium]|jgi:multidrug efflux pump subunit AcrB|nr:efflux RND transporter permease subunit [Planctomycetota bacterium]
MWIVRLALRRPYTFVVCALIVLLIGILSILSMPKDIFPEIDIPVVSVIWTYTGMSPDEMEKRVVTISERAFTGNVNDIEHIESQSMNGLAHIKVYFYPGAKIEAAVAQTSAVCQTLLRIFPPGMNAPFILRYSASNVPVVQMSVSSETLTEQEIFDYSFNFIRTQLFAVQGSTVPTPFGGKPRQIMVDIDSSKLTAKGLSARDVAEAMNLQNLILPAGTLKMGEREYNVRLNSSPEMVDALNRLPVKQVNGAVITVGDVAQVRDGYEIQTNIVRENGNRSILLTVLKNGGASTLDVVAKLKAELPRVMSTLPSSLKVRTLFDQSLFVEASLKGVLLEATIAAVLTGLMILLFLGSWRSTVIVAVSIPLSILVSIIVLKLFGQTLNIMTLGGLALAVGMLVDDSTVEIENIHRNLAQGKEINHAILDGAQQIAVPAFVSTLAICIVFAPVFFLSGAAKSLFIPLALAVVFAMLASYLISRTLVPTLVKYLLRAELHMYRREHGDHAQGGLIWRVHDAFNRGFEKFRGRYRETLAWCLDQRTGVVAVFLLVPLASGLLYFVVGQDFFPDVDTGTFRLHVRAPSGTRLEATEEIVQEIGDELRKMIPPHDLASILDNIGMATSGSTIAYADPATIGSADAEILVSLKRERKGSTRDYMREIRRTLPSKFPSLVFFFEPPDMVSQILNFGLPAPIDIQVVGRDKGNYAIAQEIQRRVARIPGAVDVHLHQPLDVPELRINVDRTKASELGLTQADVAGSVLVSLSGTSQVSPNYWLNPQNGVNYRVIVQTPQHAIDSIEKLGITPVATRSGHDLQLLGNLASAERRSGTAVVNHYNVQPVFDVYAAVEGRDLAAVAREVDRIVEELSPTLPRGQSIQVRGQVTSMKSSFAGLAGGLVFAVLLVYFLMVVNFQSWLDPFIIAMALPGALAGILWMLCASHTTLNVPSLMGAIMAMGVATANSILLVTFANDRREEGADARTAALDAGFTRLRPVLMTAFAMIIGMLPMSLGLGEGGEQNAPLGRAVIGGLIFATVSTLFFVPVVYSILRKRAPAAPEVLPS